MNVLLTGATGFIGSHLARRLLRDGHRVSLLVRPSSRLEILAPELSRFAVRIYDGSYASLEAALEQAQPQIVMHLASLFLTRHRAEDIPALLEANLAFPTQLLEAMCQAGVKNFVNTGTSWQHYQDQPYSPVNLYAASKQAFEALLAYYAEAHGLRAVSLKLFDTYGPGDRRSKLFSLLRKCVRSGETLKMSPGEQLLDLVYIDDVVEAFIQAGLRVSAVVRPEQYAVSAGTDARVSVQHLAQLYAELCGRELAIEWGGIPYRPREVMQPWSQYRLLPGWQARTSLQDGILAMERDPTIGGLLAESTE